MATGIIIDVLSNIPWGQVVRNALKIMDVAANLLNAVNRKQADQLSDVNAKTGLVAAQSDAEVLKRRLAVMEENILYLEERMGAAAELIKELAEQNIQLVRKIELNSGHLIRFAKATTISVVALIGVIVYLLLRP